MNRRGLREHAPSILVAALGSAFGVGLLLIITAISFAVENDNVTGSSQTVVPLLLSIVAVVFIIIAVYVSAVVTANTFATIIAGRTRTIALMRLLGSSATAQRRAVAGEGFFVGAVGSLIGAVAGTGLVAIALAILVANDVMPAISYPLFTPSELLPIIGVFLTTWLASWVGSRRVLVVTPMQATGTAVEPSREDSTRRPGRNAAAITLFVIGSALLWLGILVGLASPAGVLIGVVGGVLSFSGLVLGAHLVMPPALRLVGLALGRGAAARIAAENAVRYPERSSRTTIGIVIGVTLVTMFAVAIESYQRVLHQKLETEPEMYAGIDTMLYVTMIVLSILLGFSALIAAVGLVNNLSLSIIQRTRELGLLRALGFTAGQVRTMIVIESAQLTVAAVLVGLVLGIFYGWAGAQSMFGSLAHGFIVPAVPPILIGVLALAALLLTIAASLAPSRRATRVSPIMALAVE